VEPGDDPKWREADELNEQGRVHLDEGELDHALRLFRRSVELRPDMAVAWFNIGLVHKWRREWPACADANLRAAELMAEPQHPAWWNLGIAATATGNWTLARRAWEGLGLELPGTDGPIEGDFGLGAVRLQPVGEVVWGLRLDPCRMRVLNVPLPDSGHRWNDVVLHDGEPRGRRTLEGRDYSVFDEILRLTPSASPTIDAEVVCPGERDREVLVQLFDDAGYGAEDWTESLHLLCKACSEGDPDHIHEPVRRPWEERRRVGLSAPDAMARELLRVWEKSPGREVLSVETLAVDIP
jgi:tetratricopeptide (TPR) repeat protein